MHVDWFGGYDCHKAAARSRWARVYSRRSVVDHCRVDGHLRVASDCHGVGARGRGVCVCVFVDSRRALIDHPRLDADIRVASDCRGSGARSLQVNAC